LRHVHASRVPTHHHAGQGLTAPCAASPPAPPPRACRPKRTVLPEPQPPQRVRGKTDGKPGATTGRCPSAAGDPQSVLTQAHQLDRLGEPVADSSTAATPAPALRRRRQACAVV
jgi:hypothetical protein